MKNQVLIVIDLLGYETRLSLKDAVKLLSLYKNIDKIGMVKTIE